jgi:P27 family predicted phage terminase small subunit
MSHRTPTHLQLLRGNPSKRPLRPELEPLQAAEPPKPPKYLTGYARVEWRRLAPELHRLGLLTILDVAALAAYCLAYARWRTVEEELARATEVDAKLAQVSASARKAMSELGAQLGLSPISRSRIGVGTARQPGKFDDLIA